MKKVTVITPAYNAEKYIKRCIDSVLGQTYSNIEHIVINDGSSDNTKQICEQYNNKKLKVISIPNGGVSNARNLALREATGEFIVFVDSDDWLEHDAIEYMVRKTIENNVDVVVCSYKNYYENSNKFETIKMIDKYGLLISNILDETTNFGGYPWNKLIRKDIIKKTYNSNVHYYENLLFFAENINEKISYCVVNKPLYNYCINDSSALHSKKYSVKKVTQLDALLLVIKSIPNQFKDYYKYLFVANYYENLFNIKENGLDVTIIQKFYSNLKNFYKEIRFSKKINLKMKLKLIILHRLNFIYVLKKSFFKY